jgi:hypothetical protein
MTEEDTYRRLIRRPFKEVFYRIQALRERRHNIDADIKEANRLGWTYLEYCRELKNFIDQANNLP